ncbi:MAG: radical SAM protein [Gemmatimonadetes bacterium]|nr:radical SAM protein [Gemmatimonadota bacterium]
MADATLPVLGAKSPRPDAGSLWDTIVNGPVRSRRLGVSLGLNLIPARSKLCTFDCPYCECGFNTPKAPEARWPSPDEVAHSLRRALTRLGTPPDCITFAGNGEPTMHPRFPVVVDRVLVVRDELAPRCTLGILTNGLAAGKPAIRDALLRLDARMVKLDPGPPELVNGVRYDQARLVADARGLAPVIVQAMVTKGSDWDGSSEASLAAWLPLVAAVEPTVVHLYSLDRAPADPTLQNVPRERLEAMAVAVRVMLPGSDVKVF